MSNQDTESRAHAHYFKDVRHLDYIDVYRVIDLFAVDHPAMQHALKKVLAAGERGAKSQEQDAQEAIDSLNRYLQMVAEDCNSGVATIQGVVSAAQSTTLEDGSTLTASLGNPQPLDLTGVKEVKVSGFTAMAATPSEIAGKGGDAGLYWRADQDPPATEKPWLPDNSGEWVEVPDDCMSCPLVDGVRIEVLKLSERQDKKYYKEAHIAGAWTWNRPPDYFDRTVAYKVVK